MWGYSIAKSQSIVYDQNDRTIINYVLEQEPSLRTCMACGGCTSTCSAGNLVPFNIRRLNTLLQRGEYAQVKKEIYNCMLCGKCTIVCPRGVNIRNVVLKTREAIMNSEKIDANDTNAI